jgi:hypothetical protein
MKVTLPCSCALLARSRFAGLIMRSTSLDWRTAYDVSIDDADAQEMKREMRGHAARAPAAAEPDRSHRTSQADRRQRAARPMMLGGPPQPSARS